MAFRAIEWLDDSDTLRLIDQKVLPQQVRYLELNTTAEIAGAIHDMTVRGAPAIGVAAAFGILQAARSFADAPAEEMQSALQQADAVLRASRSVSSRLRLDSTCSWIALRESPRSFGPSPMGNQTLVASTAC